IGNTGVNDDDPESRRIWVSGYVVREPSPTTSSWRARRSLDEELAAQGGPGIAITGTRALTPRPRGPGGMRAPIRAPPPPPRPPARRAGDLPAGPPPPPGSRAPPRPAGSPPPAPPRAPPPPPHTPPSGAAGVARGIRPAPPAAMAARGCLVQVLPATATAAEI